MARGHGKPKKPVAVKNIALRRRDDQEVHAVDAAEEAHSALSASRRRRRRGIALPTALPMARRRAGPARVSKGERQG